MALASPGIGNKGGGWQERGELAWAITILLDKLKLKLELPKILATRAQGVSQTCNALFLLYYFVNFKYESLYCFCNIFRVRLWTFSINWAWWNVLTFYCSCLRRQEIGTNNAWKDVLESERCSELYFLRYLSFFKSDHKISCLPSPNLWVDTKMLMIRFATLFYIVSPPDFLWSMTVPNPYSYNWILI